MKKLLSAGLFLILLLCMSMTSFSESSIITPETSENSPARQRYLEAIASRGVDTESNSEQRPGIMPFAVKSYSGSFKVQPTNSGKVTMKWSASTQYTTSKGLGSLTRFSIAAQGSKWTKVISTDYDWVKLDGGRTIAIWCTFQTETIDNSIFGGPNAYYYDSFDAYIEVYASGGYSQW